MAGVKQHIANILVSSPKRHVPIAICNKSFLWSHKYMINSIQDSFKLFLVSLRFLLRDTSNS